MNEFAGKRVLVVGLGASGFAAARALLSLDAKVRVTDAGAGGAVEERAARLRASGAEVETGGHDLDRLDADLAVLSPGIAPTAPIVRALQEEGIETYGEVELAYRLARCDFLAVTGTNGKTTTTSLLARILEEGGLASVAAGNIGLPLVDAVFSVPDGGAIAVEVSSFQLATITTFRPRVAVVLNVAEDHLDWHGSADAYVQAKGRIVENQTPDDVFLPNYEDERAMSIASRARSRVVPFSPDRVPPEEGSIGFDGAYLVWRDERVVAVEDVPLLGRAGLEDAAAAAGAALEFGIDRRAVARGLKAFRALAHRMDPVAVLDGVTYIDDSKATNPHATLSAVAGLDRVVLIAGGRSKGIDLSPLGATVPPVVAVVALGEARREVERAFRGVVPVDMAESMRDAVLKARARAIPGGSVLLSPACASLDMYESYAHRGEDFCSAVRELVASGDSLPEGG